MSTIKKSATEQLVWRKATSFHGLQAQPSTGEFYQALDCRRHFGHSGYGAFFRPKQGRSRFPKDRQGLGTFDSVAKAKARCEEHFRALIEDPSRAKAVAP